MNFPILFQYFYLKIVQEVAIENTVMAGFAQRCWVKFQSFEKTFV